MRKTALCFLVLSCITNAFSTALARPKVGLVLSGGGARCAAHIGVIEVLEENNIPIDFIVGTSMGAVIGGLYASGVPIQKIKADFSDLHWEKIFSEKIQRKELYYRRKLDSDIFLIRNFISYSEGRLRFPYGIISGQKLYETFNRYLLPKQPIPAFTELPIPFKAVSTDLVSGNPIVLDQGDLALSMLASMAVPGLISPIRIENYLLVDGGVSRNLPIEVARAMGMDILIVVDTGTPLDNRSEIIDLTAVLGQLTNIMTQKNVKESEQYLTEKDIFLKPEIKIGTSDFKYFGETIILGKIAALKAIERLKLLAVDSVFLVEEENKSDLEFDGILVSNPEICPKTYDAYLDFKCELVTEQEITQKIRYLYGLSIFDLVCYGLEEFEEEKVLHITPKFDETKPLYFQVSFELDTDFDITNTFAIALGIMNPRVNALLGEWRIIGQVGQGEGVFAEYYQPITPDLSWFVNPFGSIQRTPKFFYENTNPIVTYTDTSSKLGLLLGKGFSNWGRLSGYWKYQFDDLQIKSGCVDSLCIDALLEERFHNGEIGAIFEWDTLDNAYFPHHGLKGYIDISTYDKAYGGQTHFAQMSIENLGAISAGKHTLALSGSYNRTLENVPTFPQKYTLGGLFELTGLAQNALLGNNSALLRAIYYYKYKKIEFIPNNPSPIYLGASLETGKVWGGTNIASHRFIESGSLFVGMNSIIGPVYFAGGITDTGKKALHLTLRPIFK